MARLEDLRVGRVGRLMCRVMQSGSFGCEARFLLRVFSGGVVCCHSFFVHSKKMHGEG